MNICSLRLFSPIHQDPIIQEAPSSSNSEDDDAPQNDEVSVVKRSLNCSASASSTPEEEYTVKKRSDDALPASDETEQSLCSSLPSEFETMEEAESNVEFTKLRCNYLLVTLAVMLADGLQGTHLYVLYESYGFSVATLYAIGFAFGAITTPITGPLIDKFGRKKSALLYCVLEIGINLLEQYPFFAGLIVSRVVGGVTTNLLSSVFETWLDTEYRYRGFDNEKYEIVMRDSVVVSNVAAIASGYLAHVLAERFGPVGPFQGAVTCTALALVVIFLLWNENYGGQGTTSTSTGTGSAADKNNNNDTENESDATTTTNTEPKKSMFEYGKEAFDAFRNDSRVLRVGIIQGLTVGSLQIFIFLWSPTLQTFAQSAMPSSMGLDGAGEPAYGLIFGGFMAAGVAGGLLSPFFRKVTTSLLSPLAKKAKLEEITVDGEEIRPMAVEFLASGCYILASMLLLVPCLMDASDENSFSISVTAFVVYELLVGVMMPCEGVIRSLYLPSDARASMMTLPRIIVNLAVALGVIITRSITTQLAFGAISILMAVAAILQLSLISKREWDCLFGKVDKLRESASEKSQQFRRSSSQFLSRMVSSSVLDDSEDDAELLLSKKLD